MREGAVAWHLPERVGGEGGGHLRRCTDVDDNGFAAVFGNRGCEQGFDLGFGLGGLEDDVAAGDVSSDRLEAKRLAHGLEFCHGQLAGAHDVHGAKKSDVGIHLHRSWLTWARRLLLLALGATRFS